MIRAITKEVHYTLSCSFIDIKDTIHICLGKGVWVTGLVCVWFVFVFISVFSTLVCLFPYLFMCPLFRVYLVFRLASSVTFVCVYFCVYVY